MTRPISFQIETLQPGDQKGYEGIKDIIKASALKYRKISENQEGVDLVREAFFERDVLRCFLMLHWVDARTKQSALLFSFSSQPICSTKEGEHLRASSPQVKMFLDGAAKMIEVRVGDIDGDGDEDIAVKFEGGSILLLRTVSEKEVPPAAPQKDGKPI